MENSSKLRKIIKPCLIGLVFIGLAFFSPLKKSKTPFFLNLSNLYLTPFPSLSQHLFADPNQKTKSELPEFIFLEKNTLQSTLPPYLITPQVLGALIEGQNLEKNRREIIEYVVEPGDTLSSLAEKFKISVETICWANNLKKNSKILPGQKLIILPVSGVIHYVKAGDTISEIAKKYKGEIEEIVAFNELSSENDIYVGDILIIPNGKIPPPPQKNIQPNITSLPSSYFICPITPPCYVTQGLHWFNAVDLSHGKCGEPIFAAAGGKVLKVKLSNSPSPGIFGGAGNHITILHPNGVVTYYGHILTSLVKPGEEVSQGQIIAFMGGQPGMPGAGRSTGCHLHFGIMGARNPFVK